MEQIFGLNWSCLDRVNWSSKLVHVKIAIPRSILAWTGSCWPVILKEILFAKDIETKVAGWKYKRSLESKALDIV